jgi:hypothetical protein
MSSERPDGVAVGDAISGDMAVRDVAVGATTSSDVSQRSQNVAAEKAPTAPASTEPAQSKWKIALLLCLILLSMFLVALDRSIIATV